jgi:hypothetical protein
MIGITGKSFLIYIKKRGGGFVRRNGERIPRLVGLGNLPLMSQPMEKK